MYCERLWTLQDVFFMLIDHRWKWVELHCWAAAIFCTVPRDHLEYLVENRFTIPQIAELIGDSHRTVHRRMGGVWLIHIIAVYRSYRRVPWGSYEQHYGHLLARGLRVQQHRVREIQTKIDPNGSIMRRLSTINRRVYQVPGPKSPLPHWWKS